ncbi:acyl carrier protein [Lapidilactobacillus mulanensis]|uniref:Acyl carrier protein n=1 Tax=Lapidilactobacillus mulanensis TaxID=2485999 RepID=A0ABW4DLY0_9LACO|nr:phosphopantetheine-binding protein [Lapidilactobacillus mulanensis]
MTDIKEFLKKSLNQIGIDDNEISESSKLKNDFELDSTEMVDFVLSIKKEYGISLNLAKNDDFSFQQIAKMIDNELKK